MRAVFETSTIADAVAKAAKIAPTKVGTSFDKAAGILFIFGEEYVTVKATNLNIFYTQAVNTLEIEGTGVWRLSSMIMNGILSKLPIGSGKTVSLELDAKSDAVLLKSGRLRAYIHKMDPVYFPEWDAFDPDSLDIVSDLGKKIQMVEWAADSKGNPPLSGVHIDGQRIVAANIASLASIPLEAPPIYEPITVPVGIFDPVIKSMSDVAVGINHGQFLLMPDPSTQIISVIYADKYPNLDRAMNRTHDGVFKINKTEITDMIDRAMVFGQQDRVPLLSMYVGMEEFAVSMEDADLGLLGESMNITGYAVHDRMRIYVTPKNLLGAVRNAPSEQIEIHYFVGDAYKSLWISDGSGYEAWVMPRKPPGPVQAAP